MRLKWPLHALVVVFAVVVSTSAMAREIVIKFSHVVAQNTPKGQMANFFRDIVNEKLAGKVRVEVFPSSQLYTDKSVLEAMLLGDVQLAAPALSKFGQYTKKLQIFDLPFLFNDMAAVERFQSGPEGRKLLHSMRKKGLLGLGYLHQGLKQFSSNKPIRVPADAEGLKFRIMSSNVLQAQFEAVNAFPLKKPFSEVFTLLQTKAVDGQESPWSNMYSKKFFEVQDYITESNHGLLDYLVVTSAKFWNGLPTDIRGVLEEAMKTAIAHGNKISFEKAVHDRQAIIDSGKTKVIALTDAERGQWIRAMKPVWKQFERQVGRKNIDAAIAANK